MRGKTPLNLHHGDPPRKPNALATCQNTAQHKGAKSTLKSRQGTPAKRRARAPP